MVIGAGVRKAARAKTTDAPATKTTTATTAKVTDVTSTKPTHLATAEATTHVTSAPKATHVATATPTAAAGLCTRGNEAAGKHCACQNHHNSSSHDILHLDGRTCPPQALPDVGVSQRAKPRSRWRGNRNVYPSSLLNSYSSGSRVLAKGMSNLKCDPSRRSSRYDGRLPEMRRKSVVSKTRPRTPASFSRCGNDAIVTSERVSESTLRHYLIERRWCVEQSIWFDDSQRHVISAPVGRRSPMM
jgi:hypothetical protein